MAERVKKTKKEDSVEENFVIEDAFERLEEIVSKLESGNLQLEESVALYNEGSELAEKCKKALADADATTIIGGG
ncbi:exodeoxyribonuclease VII small subunit, partial [Eubacterium ruminantium]|uniref:exodeoxyribonuclease VII small subunit n=1 Tax=Eubacterium ruminantium TaxID=42322 RepID=UPI002479B765